MTDKRPEEDSLDNIYDNSSGDNFWANLIASAVVFGVPVLIGFLSEKNRQAQQAQQAQEKSSTTIRSEQPITANKPIRPKVDSALIKSATRDITAEDRRGDLKNILGRGREINLIATLLSSPQPEFILLVGEHQIGKTAIVEGLAQAIHHGSAPDLRGYAILEFGPESLLDSQSVKDTNEKAKDFLQLISAHHDRVIAVFDNFNQTIQEIERQAYRSDVIRLIQQALVSHKLRGMAICTPEEYHRLFSTNAWRGCFHVIRMEKKAASEDPFGELGVDQVHAILQEHIRTYPQKFGITVDPQAIETAINLADQYMPDRLPGKAIRLLDETAKKMRPRWESTPPKLLEVQENIQRLEDQLAQSNRNLRFLHAQALADIESRLETLRLKQKELNKTWQEVQSGRQELSSVMENISMLYRAVESAALNSDDDLAKDYQKKIDSLQPVRHDLSSKLEKLQNNLGLKEILDASDVANELAYITNHPIQPPNESEEQLLLSLRKRLQARLIGQEAAINAVSNAILRSRAGTGQKNHPVGVFMFLGPTGVGKTELAKALASIWSAGEYALIRFDLSTFKERHSVDTLIGSPPGYVGYESGGQLTEAVYRTPRSVILFDEVEKAHPEVLDTLMPVFDDARLVDRKGKVVDFQQSIIIMTSNIGSKRILKMGSEAAKHLVLEDLKGNLMRPEILNRVDEVVFFNPLSPQDARKIVDIEFKKLQDQLLKEKGLLLTLSEDAGHLIAEMGYSEEFGAREIKRKINVLIGDPLSLIIIKEKPQSGETLLIDRLGNRLQITRQENKNERSN